MQATQHKPYTHLSYKKAHIALLIHLLVKIHDRHTQSKGEDMITALVRSVVAIYYWGLIPVYVFEKSKVSFEQ